MPKTLFVVDDSATMRKVFELTFAGEDLTVVTHDGTDGVVARAREVRPNVAIVDVALNGQQTGYDVVRSLRADAESGTYPIFVLHSDHSPLDEAAARSAGASGALVKPFETQVMIDRVRQVLSGSPGVVAPVARPATPPAAVVPRAAPVASPLRGTSSALGNAIPPVRPAPAPLAKPQAPVPVPVPAPPAAASAVISAALRAQSNAMPAITIEDSDEELQLESGLLSDLRPMSEPPPAAFARPTPARTDVVNPVAVVAPARADATRVSVPAPSPVADSASAEIARRVASLGLTAAQVDAITALTREVVERVVWEVVPVLAETAIREEIQRLTAENPARG